MGSTARVRIRDLKFLFKFVYCILYARKKASTVASKALQTETVTLFPSAVIKPLSVRTST